MAESKRVETRLLDATWDVDRRLSQLHLSRAKLLDVVSFALAERGHATPFHAANAAGTFAYQYGTFALRDRFVPDGWHIDRTDGIESIRDDELAMKVAFQNVDLACNHFHLPKPRSDKGAGAERAASGNLFGHLPQYAPMQAGGMSLWYLMSDEEGHAELTLPVVKHGAFIAAIERIFLGQAGMDAISIIDDRDGIADEFDPQIARK